MWGHVRVHIFNRPINDNPTKSLGIKAEYLPRAVVRLGYRFRCLVYDLMVKDEWKVIWHDPKQDVVRFECIAKKKKKKATTNI
jgi:hypothetical protein